MHVQAGFFARFTDGRGSGRLVWPHPSAGQTPALIVCTLHEQNTPLSVKYGGLGSHLGRDIAEFMGEAQSNVPGWEVKGSTVVAAHELEEMLVSLSIVWIGGVGQAITGDRLEFVEQR